MKAKLEVDCTPAEARAFLGLPDVAALNDHMVKEMRRRMDANLAAAAPEELKADDPLKVTDAERDALTFTAYDLDVHLTPASAGISVRAGVTVRNDGAAPRVGVCASVISLLTFMSVIT